MAYTQCEIAQNVADQYTREYLKAWLSEYDTGDEAKAEKVFARVNKDRVDAGLEPIDAKNPLW